MANIPKQISTIVKPGGPVDRAIQKARVQSRGIAEAKRKSEIFLSQGFGNPSKRYLEGTTGYDEDYRTGMGVDPNRQYIFGRSTLNKISRQVEEREEQYAILRVLRKATKEENKDGALLINIVPPFTRFLIENVQETYDEKMQVLETFGDYLAFFYGKRPETYTFSGTLLNMKNHDWAGDFSWNYENYIRGTKCVENNARVYISYNDTLVEGFIYRAATGLSAANPNGMQFTFSILVTERVLLSNVENKHLNVRYLDKIALTPSAAQQLLNSMNSTTKDIIAAFLKDGVAAGEVEVAGEGK